MTRVTAGATALIAGILTLLATSAADAQHAGDAARTARSPFVGHWELVRYQSFRPGGEVVEMSFVARILFDEHGNMSAIGMPRDLPERPTGPGGERPREGFAYFGTYDVRPGESTVVYHVQGSPMSAAMVGTDLPRSYRFSGDLLALTVSGADGRPTARFTWRRLR